MKNELIDATVMFIDVCGLYRHYRTSTGKHRGYPAEWLVRYIVKEISPRAGTLINLG